MLHDKRIGEKSKDINIDIGYRYRYTHTNLVITKYIFKHKHNKMWKKYS